ncbi:Endonuclease/exonuclease/phosphatase [Hypoxylon cercidicola]|nr:Endonuclease/exonuclease/phosphatase [Hypoxylon cercidicola]
MAFFSRLRTQVLSWSNVTPLPGNEPDAVPSFQSWYAFDSSNNRWSPAGSGNNACNTAEITRRSTDGATTTSKRGSPGLVLITWNVDYSSKEPEARMTAILTHIQHSDAAADLIFFQEVSRPALTTILQDQWVREGWYVSEADATNWGKQAFATVSLISRSRFGQARSVKEQPTLGAIWRVKYPSRYERDALCCDIFLPSSSTLQVSSPPAASNTRVRFVNVHLDSLPIQPSFRPRQLSIVTSILRTAGCGLVAGDFNPVLPEDETLLGDNRLVDAWAELHPDHPGFTWGINGDQPFPPNRLDKIGMLGLKAQSIEVMLCDNITSSTSLQAKEGTEAAGLEQKEDNEEVIPWSDHAGLKCSFALV